MKLEQLNVMPREDAERELLKCCGSTRWAARVADERPFHGLDQLLRTADDAWWKLEDKDWLEAFSHHPKIGGRRAKADVSEDARRWSEEEQKGAQASAEGTMLELEEANREYERRFGYIFIVCATGKTSAEMLALLKDRMKNDASVELRVAAEEQRRITQLRLKKLLES